MIGWAKSLSRMKEHAQNEWMKQKNFQHIMDYLIALFSLNIIKNVQPWILFPNLLKRTPRGGIQESVFNKTSSSIQFSPVQSLSHV